MVTGCAPAPTVAAKELRRCARPPRPHRRGDVSALVLHALIISGLLGLYFSAAFLLFGPQLYRFMDEQAGSLDAALRYSNVVFGANVLIWLLCQG